MKIFDVGREVQFTVDCEAEDFINIDASDVMSVHDEGGETACHIFSHDEGQGFFFG